MGQGSSGSPPRWLELTEAISGWVVPSAQIVIDARRGSADHRTSASLALLHFASCMDHLVEANRRGHHSVAVSLMRQCIEALTIVELGLLQDDVLAEDLLGKWADNKKTLGAIRKALEADVWDSYGPGLGGESWTKFFGRLAGAVQPYAHCSRPLVSWQLKVEQHSKQSDGGLLMVTRLGGYDPVKASVVTLLQAVVVWSLGALLVNLRAADAGAQVEEEDVTELGTALVASDFFMQGQDWEVQFWPFLLFDGVPEGDARQVVRGGEPPVEG